MQQENEELERACHERTEEHDLMTENTVMSRTISEQSLQQECQQLETNSEQRKEEQRKREEDLKKYYAPQLECLVEQNKRLQYELNALSLSSPMFDPASPPISSSSSSPTSVGREEDYERLDKILNVCEKFGPECMDVLLKRKIQVLKGYIMCDQAKIRRILNEVRRTAKKHLSVIRAQEEELKSTKRELRMMKKLFNDVIGKEKSKYNTRAAEWKIKLRNALVSKLNQEQRIYELNWENRALRNSNRTAEKHENCSDSVETFNGGNSKLGSDSTIPIAEYCDDTVASTLTPIVTSGDGTDTAESTTALINTSNTTGEVADAAESITVPNSTGFSSSRIKSTNTKTLTSSNSSPLLKTALNRNANNLNSMNTKRKENPTDIEKASKKIKSSIEPACKEDGSEIDREREAKRRTLTLAKEVLQLRNQLRGVAAYHMKLQQACKERNFEIKDILKDQKDFIPYNWLNLVSQQTTARQNSRAVPITHKDARAFSEEVSFINTTFSMKHYSVSSMNPKFLLYYPIGIVNYGGTFCYLNSVVQALSNLPRFAVSAVCSLDHEEGSLLHAMFELYKYSWVRRPDAQYRQNTPILHSNEIRNYYSRYRSADFDPALQHDADEFLVDLIKTLETEVSEDDPDAGEDNFIKHLFSGYICYPNGTRELFRTLRLSIVDDGIDSVEKALLYHLVYKPPRSTQPEPPTMQTSLGTGSSPSASSIPKQSDKNVSLQGAQREQISCIPSSGMGRASEVTRDELQVASEICKETRRSGVSNIETHSPGISQSIDSSLLGDSPIQMPSSDDTRHEKVGGRDDISEVHEFQTKRATTHEKLTGSEDSIRTIAMEDSNPSQTFVMERVIISSVPLDETVDDTNKSKDNIDSKPKSSVTTVDNEENLTFTENTGKSEQSEAKLKQISENASPLENFPIDQMPDIPLRLDKPKPQANANPSTMEGTGDCNAHRRADSSLDKINSVTEKYCKIYAAEILCVTLDRHNSDNSFNWKVIPADDLTIPPQLRSPEGATCPAFYKLMSIIQYVPAGPTSGHYYTYVKTGRNSGYMLNDRNVSRVENEAFDLTAFGGRSSIFVYIKRPNFLPSLPFPD